MRANTQIIQTTEHPCLMQLIDIVCFYAAEQRASARGQRLVE